MSPAHRPRAVTGAVGPPRGPGGSVLVDGDARRRWWAGRVFRGFADDAVELGPQPLLVVTDQRPELGVHCLGTECWAGVTVVAHRVSPPCHDHPYHADVCLL